MNEYRLILRAMMPTARCVFNDCNTFRSSGYEFSTAALGSLLKWSARGSGRGYKVHLDTKDALVADLEWEATDFEADGDLKECCRKARVSRT